MPRDLTAQDRKGQCFWGIGGFSMILCDADAPSMMSVWLKWPGLTWSIRRDDGARRNGKTMSTACFWLSFFSLVHPTITALLSHHLACVTAFSHVQLLCLSITSSLRLLSPPSSLPPSPLQKRKCQAGVVLVTLPSLAVFSLH